MYSTPIIARRSSTGPECDPDTCSRRPKLKPGYANFAIDEPPLKLVLNSPGNGAAATINHLGARWNRPIWSSRLPSGCRMRASTWSPERKHSAATPAN
jgi:hypothetical protein